MFFLVFAVGEGVGYGCTQGEYDNLIKGLLVSAVSLCMISLLQIMQADVNKAASCGTNLGIPYWNPAIQSPETRIEAFTVVSSAPILLFTDNPSTRNQVVSEKSLPPLKRTD